MAISHMIFGFWKACITQLLSIPSPPKSPLRDAGLGYIVYPQPLQDYKPIPAHQKQLRRASTMAKIHADVSYLKLNDGNSISMVKFMLSF